MRPTDKFTHLASGSKLFGTTRTSRIVSFSALFFAVCAFGAVGVAPLAPDAADLPVKKITQELNLPKIDEQIAALEASEQHFIREEKVLRGDTLGSLMLRLGIDDNEANNFIKSDATAHNLLQVKAGKSVRAQTNDEGELEWLQASLQEGSDKPTRTITVSRDSSGKLSAAETSAKLERRVEMRAADIRSSLFAATDEAQIPDNIANQIVSMFETNVDFRYLQRGDHFNVVYETFWQNGEFVKTGRVLAGEFSNVGKLFQSVWFDETGGNGGYYNFDGTSLKKAFLKSPLEFTRVSSGFSMRLHPISGLWKRHTGVDFAAVTGTPIRATSDGVIESVGPHGGYGNLVVVKHWSNYSTAYAHMSRFAAGIHKGSKVSQGEVIGYVGTTGWSTGPHLHYEFRVNNEPRDPLSVSIPNAAPLAANELSRFKNVASDMTHRFTLLRPERQAEVMKLAAK
ncbi:MAG: peptidoglycan DD-metalloendopeptidase family protein [Undibacterium sp.]|uniref:M23 family metallopeptidase n=1 Tax=Undibacterium sp. TaxID=1914977 RepID=UPI002720131B|nr:M23 family metallopeptidase [Undibacterium sp.]MDO8651453.1 peptidoglycan DD-metalloendopeptidase family protein [Undibacterium sp.]